MTAGFVIPWYGENIPGGAEAACRMFVTLLHSRGLDVEVLTTCVRDFRSDWSTNYHPPGLTTEGGIRVRRFPVRVRNTSAFDAVNLRLIRNEPVTPDEEECFFREMVNSDALYSYLRTHQEEYIYFFIPYMFGTSVRGSMVCPDRSVLIPCLHDESYARLSRIAQMLRSVKQIVYLSPAEKQLAESLYGLPSEKGVVTGVPLDCSWTSDPARFVSRYGISKFLLYAGRDDAGKNAELLVDYFHKYVTEEQTSLNLVFIGGAKPPIPGSVADRVRSLGYIPVQDKYDCLGASLALCVPSVRESFSIVMMESWLAGRPVIVNAECDVTTDFCVRSNGGLWFRDYSEFREIVELLAHSPELGPQLGGQGRNFVFENYKPDLVAKKFMNAMTL
jgi:glycosyltransferase involved in cell wall biosynthesis